MFKFRQTVKFLNSFQR